MSNDFTMTKYGIFDVVEDRFFEDEDGQAYEYDSVTDARNAMFTEGYKEDGIGLFFEIVPILPADI